MARLAPELSQAWHFSSLPAVVKTVMAARREHLDRDDADAAGAAMDQQRLAGLQPRPCP